MNENERNALLADAANAATAELREADWYWYVNRLTPVAATMPQVIALTEFCAGHCVAIERMAPAIKRGNNEAIQFTHDGTWYIIENEPRLKATAIKGTK